MPVQTPSQVRTSQWFIWASRRRDEKLIKVGPLEVPKRDNSREKLHFCGFAGYLSRQNRLLSPGRLEDGSCLNLNNCLPAGGVQAPCKTVVGSRNRSQILFAQKKDRSCGAKEGRCGFL